MRRYTRSMAGVWLALVALLVAQLAVHQPQPVRAGLMLCSVTGGVLVELPIDLPADGATPRCPSALLVSVVPVAFDPPRIVIALERSFVPMTELATVAPRGPPHALYPPAQAPPRLS
ncbi:hypothetical protein ACTSKR_10670 [Chitinibacteraceae bacterium HSL-7]